MEIIRGLEKPSEGLIDKNGKAFMLFENSEEQIFNDTIKAEILYGLNEDDVDLVEICNKLQITDELWEKDPQHLSNGEMRKIAMASMLAFNPDIILIDNFLNSLDYENKKIFINILKRMQFDEHKIVIIADQNIDLLYEIVDEIIVLTDEIVLSGSKYDVFKNADLLSELDIERPKYVELVDMIAEKKNVSLPYRDRITDIVKDVYDNV